MGKPTKFRHTTTGRLPKNYYIKIVIKQNNMGWYYMRPVSAQIEEELKRLGYDPELFNQYEWEWEEQCKWLEVKSLKQIKAKIEKGWTANALVPKDRYYECCENRTPQLYKP